MHFLRCAILLLSTLGLAEAGEFSHAVPMSEKGTATYFITATIGHHSAELLVDTGAGFATLNESLIERLLDDGEARRSGEIEAVLANGAAIILPVFTIAAMHLGNCLVEDVEVAQTPPNASNLLGLSVLRKAAPFSFSLEPAELKLSHCHEPALRAEAAITIGKE